jgi:hypothetical protein
VHRAVHSWGSTTYRGPTGWTQVKAVYLAGVEDLPHQQYNPGQIDEFLAVSVGRLLRDPAAVSLQPDVCSHLVSMQRNEVY